MPVAASRKQFRFMQAVLHGFTGHPRGVPPKSIAAKYTDPGKDAPESKDNDRGGKWTEEHHKRHAKREAEKRKHLKKSFEEFYKGKGLFGATIVLDNNNRILLGTHYKGGLAYPGGHVEDGESIEDGALRELAEESGLVGRLSGKVWHGTTEGNDGAVYLAEIVSGEPKNTKEIKNWKWYEINDIPWDKLRSCCRPALKEVIGTKFGKSIRGMMSLEALEKASDDKSGNIEINQKHALKLVGVGIYRHLKRAVAKMGDEDFKELDLDTYKISIRKHPDNTYSGRVSDGHKVIYQYTNKSLHELAAALMSLFEWYLPEDADVLDTLSDENISDEAIQGGLHHLIDNYKRHNLGEIYQEMETIRETMRNGVAVDLQQVEAKILKLFDRLEETTKNLVGKHNKLAQDIGRDMDELEAKLRALQAKVNDSGKKTKTVEAVSSHPADGSKIHNKLYSYLSRPRVEIQPGGKLIITFGDDWEDMEKSNFLEDLRVKVIRNR